MTAATELMPTLEQAFDSEMLGGRVGRLDIPTDGRDVAEILGSQLADLAAGWRAEGYWLVSCRLSEPTPGTPPAAEAVLRAAGFQPVETLVTLIHDLSDILAAPTEGISAGSPKDVEACAAIGAEALVTSRYNVDPRIDPARASALKAQWVRNAFAGRADTILCAHDDGKVTGFNLLLKRGDDAIIDLIAVDPTAQRRGHGRKLVAASLAHYANSAKRMIVGTQAINAASLALYQALGFVEQQRAVTYHWMNSDA